jgi:hypothetical protein
VVGDVTLYIRQSKDKFSVHIVDDKSIEGDTFGKRRTKLLLDSLTSGVKLQKINTCLFFLGDLIRVANNKLYFIDSQGKVFKYTKSRTVPLVYRKITNTIKIIGGILIEVEGIEGRFKALFPPNDVHKYAALLKESKNSYILYGYSEIYRSDTVRKI